MPVLASWQKLEIILENKGIQKLMLSKKVNNKKCAPRFIFFNEKKIRKIKMIFDVENWLWISKILALFDTSPLHQFAKFNDFLWLELIFSQKPFWFSIPLLKTPQPVLP
jgi:hypothetical protein